MVNVQAMRCQLVIVVTFYILVTACGSQLQPPNHSVIQTSPPSWLDQVAVDPVLAQIMSRSSFYQDDPPKIQLQVQHQPLPYHPELISVAASLASRHPAHTYLTSTYEMVAQPAHQHPACAAPITAYLTHFHSPGSAAITPDDNYPPVFIILPGSFSHWHSGGHIHQIIHLLTTYLDKFYVIGLDGILSQPFLSHSCSALPWHSKHLAEDIYHRLKALTTTLGIQASRTSLIGTSGGGAIGLHMLATASTESQPLFQQGALIISPVLNSELTFATIDHMVHQTKHQRVLSDPLYFRHLVIPFIQRGSLTIYPHDLITAFQRSSQEFTERFYNEFIYVNLKESLTALKLAQPPVQQYRDTFQISAPQIAGHSQPQQAFQTANDLSYALKVITTKTLIHFPLDDPLLSDVEQRISTIRPLLTQAATNPNLHLYTPTYGGHIGAFLDPMLSELINFTFNLVGDSPYAP